ncbi:hypothetical protein WM40_13000 [Robbsia andropogonis]|uniref:Type II secretion system protein GspF domain-containing protein n=1 Tax=Robbsia andropogonis TaxID=28092 RepID=A0A0F5JZ56_9BURK|nr:type II secretion system F family protein [Robbsia andropogonis]KKB63161.1 hypothetical protein WM40_13000 [Robbsia andropogonis]MCP1117561.1 type II secretion system F family protein [Robbsia andropogonis]MCP1127027.1 type II secretion system F family protein [Robbsia andropogonis]
MSSTMLLLAAVLLGVAGIVIWQSHRIERRRAQNAGAFADRRIEAARAPPPVVRPGFDGNGERGGVQGGNAAAISAGAWTSAGAKARKDGTGSPVRQWYAGVMAAPWVESMVLRADIPAPGRWLATRIGALVGAALLAWLLVGWEMSAFVLVFGSAVCALLLHLRIGRRRNRIVRQLPVFLDLMVRQVTVGTSLNSAFQQLAPKTAQPLGAILERAAQMNRAGVELDTAVKQVARLYGIDQLLMIGAVLGVSTKFGGRSDQVLERIAGFMRDTEQARDELVALSAETRLSAWILGALPLAVALFLMCFNRQFFLGMWEDPIGARMLLGAAALQTLGSVMLYRMAKSV